MKALDWIARFQLWSRERMAVASKTELRRWFDAKNIVINGIVMEWDEPIDFRVMSVVIFPKGKRITLL